MGNREMDFQRISAFCGMIGCILILVCAWISMIPYTGMYGEAYATTNHFISELGDRRFSELAPLFNYGLMVSSSFLLVFSIGFTRQFRGWQKGVIGILGVTTSLSCFLVGAIPEDNLAPHILVAMVFFHSALVLVFLNTAITMFAKKPILPKWTTLLGFVTAASFAAFVVSPNDIVRDWIQDPACFERPSVWVKCILEWACFYSIIIWILVAAALMLKRKKSMAHV